MKKTIVAACALSALCAVADETKPAEQEAELTKTSSWTDRLGFYGNTGVYSGYQLYGSLVNPEPTIQGYVQGTFNMGWDELDFGQLYVGCWFNNDLTGRRSDGWGRPNHNGTVRRAFNEFDPQFGWSRTFWFDNDHQYGLFYKSYMVWYYYPHPSSQMYHKVSTTFDWDHYFEFKNPWVIPYLNYVHEFHESDGNLLQFGVKKPFGVCDDLTLTPSLEFVWRNSNYNWCFATDGFTEYHGSGLATMKIGLDANYHLCDHVGLFAKIAYCQTLDGDLRDASDHSSGADYGKYKDFVWGGIGVEVYF